MKYKGKVDGYYLVNYLADMESKFFICQCDSPEHQLTFNYFPDERGGDVYLWIHLRSIYGDFDEFIFKKEDANKLQAIVDYLKA